MKYTRRFDGLNFEGLDAFTGKPIKGIIRKEFVDDGCFYIVRTQDENQEDVFHSEYRGKTLKSCKLFLETGEYTIFGNN